MGKPRIDTNRRESDSCSFAFIRGWFVVQSFMKFIPGKLRAGTFTEFANHLAVAENMIVGDVKLFLKPVNEQDQGIELLRRGLIDRKIADKADADAVLVDVR